MNDVRGSIEWADWFWNPVTGCKNGCHYCYAKRIYSRFNDTPFEEIVFHPERLSDPRKLKKPSRIFVGSMSDHRYWSPDMWAAVLTVVADCPRHTFLFLTKDMHSSNIVPIDNCMFGLTMEHLNSGVLKYAVKQFGERNTRPFLSIEPIVDYSNMDIPDKYELVIVGAMTGPGRRLGENIIMPERRWFSPGRRLGENIIMPERRWFSGIRHYNIFYKRNLRDHFEDLKNNKETK